MIISGIQIKTNPKTSEMDIAQSAPALTPMD